MLLLLHSLDFVGQSTTVTVRLIFLIVYSLQWISMPGDTEEWFATLSTAILCSPQFRASLVDVSLSSHDRSMFNYLARRLSTAIEYNTKRNCVDFKYSDWTDRLTISIL